MALTTRKIGLIHGALAGFAALMAAGVACAQAYAIHDDTPAQAQRYAPNYPPAQPYRPESRAYEAGRRIGDIVTQPARDVNLDRTDIPPVLLAASENPYQLDGARNCEQLAYLVRDLDEVLGPDFAARRDNPESRTGKLAEAGGRMAVNSLIPLRGLVREVSGAATAQRQLDIAIDAGIARRGFLHGMQSAMGCSAYY